MSEKTIKYNKLARIYWKLREFNLIGFAIRIRNPPNFWSILESGIRFLIADSDS